MGRKPFLRGPAGRLVVFTLALALLSAAPAFSARKKVPPKGEVFGWELEGATVANPGKVYKTRQGILISGCVIEASASRLGRAPFEVGIFRLNFTAFSPYQDMPRQKAGFWYVQGDWTITDEAADEQLKKVRHSPAVVRGSLKTRLTFNPLEQSGQVTASVRVPRMAEGAGRGQGTFQGNELFEGTLQLALGR
jgi:hypothetical protein